jgi:hypothetical protein
MTDTQTIKMLTTSQVAKALGCSRVHVHRLIYSGQLKAITISKPGSTRLHKRISENDLAEFINGSAV